MQEGTGAAATPQAAYTDLYDEQRSRFLVQYPPLLIILLGLGGVLAILITGFQGYNVPVSGSNPVTYTYPNFAEELFHEPWLLFFWFCALMVTIQWSIFRHPSLTRQRVQTLIATGISIVLVILGYFFRGQLQNIGIQIGNFINAIFQVNISQGLALALINYGIIAIFWTDSIRRWVRRYQNKPFAPNVPIGLPTGSTRARQVVPSLQELVAGDFIAGGVLTAALWGIFSPAALDAVSQALNLRGASTPIPQCAFECSLGDRNQMFVYFFVGLLLLAFTAVLNGLVALNAVSRQVAPAIAVAKADETGTDKGTKGVVQTLVETILGIFSRFGRNLLGTLVLAVRASIWPFMILIATAGLAIAARYVQYYLHGASCTRNSAVVLACDAYSKGHFDNLSLGGDAAAVIGSLAVAVLGIVAGAALLVYNGRVFTNTLRFLQLIGLILLLTFWLFNLAFASLNLLLTDVFNITPRQPFLPGVGAAVSFIALVVYAISFFTGRARRGDNTPLTLSRLRGPATVARMQAEAAPAAVTVPADGTSPTTPTTLAGAPVKPKDESA